MKAYSYYRPGGRVVEDVGLVLALIALFFMLWAFGREKRVSHPNERPRHMRSIRPFVQPKAILQYGGIEV